MNLYVIYIYVVLCYVRKTGVESDEDIEDVTEEQEKVEEEEEDDEIIESDVELEGETCQSDDDPPQKVFILFYCL